MEQQPNYWGILPADVRYADISSSAKVLYAEFSALTNKEGFSWASDSYFAKLYGVSRQTVNGWVQELKNAGLIEVDTVKDKEGTRRKIKLALVSEKTHTPVLEEPDTNNTSSVITIINTISKDIEPKAYGKPEINEMFDMWEQIVGYKITSNLQKNRFAISNLNKKLSKTEIEQLLRGVAMTADDKYAPRIEDFVALQSKMNALLAWGRKNIKPNNVRIN